MVSIVVVVAAVTLVAGYLLKAQCLAGFDGRQYERLCYNDIQPLYGIRGVDQNIFPYVNGGLVDGDLANGAIEYPVGTGLFMWATGLLVGTSNSYLVVSALLLGPLGLLTAWWLARMTGWRALMWAAAPAVVLYAFHNWDLLVVAATVGGFYAWWRGWPVWAAVAFGVGAAFKTYPILFLAPLLLERWWAGRRAEGLATAGAGIGVFAAINLPFAVSNFSGWWATYEFHRLRGPNFDNIWAWPRFGLDALGAEQLNSRTAFLMIAFGLVALGIGGLQARRFGAYPFVQVSAALLITFLLWNKVHSPQYALWLLPFFALLRLHWAWWGAYAVVDLLVYIGVFRYFFDLVYLAAPGGTDARGAMVFGVWARAALLVGLFVAVLYSRSAVDPPSVTPVTGSVVADH